MHDMLNVGNVETPGGHVGRNQQTRLRLGEAFKVFQPLLLMELNQKINM